MEYGLTESEQRGYLTYMRPDYSHAVDVAGWYRVQGGTVVRRKVGGRNWSAFCSVESVDSFVLYDAAAEKFARELAVIVARTRAAN
jgi:hypothetical protein